MENKRVSILLRIPESMHERLRSICQEREMVLTRYVLGAILQRMNIEEGLIHDKIMLKDGRISKE